MIKSALRRVGETFAPKFTKRVSRAISLREAEREFRSAFDRVTTLEERVDIALTKSKLRSNQKRTEILALLRVLESLRPAVLCEIGADRGGTLALFASVATPDARILSIDIDYPGSRAKVYQTLKQPDQRTTCLQADSHAESTQTRVRDWLKGDAFDFLFIDGDHSYDGVKADYEMYAPLVRCGGIVAFHDIVPDFLTRYGTKTSSDVGEVPQYWSDICQTAGEATEFIEDPEQDGYGIGMIRVGQSQA